MRGLHLPGRDFIHNLEYTAIFTSQTPPMQAHMVHLLKPNSYRYSATVIRTPYTSHTLVDTLHRLRNPLQLLPARISQQFRLLQYLSGFEIPYADGFMASVDVVPCYHRMPIASRGYGYFDLGIGGSESREFVADESSTGFVREEKHDKPRYNGLLHSP
jgi:hypothetical protein